jgi:murein DD-endopeptidase MepM/ murein hydrolase activator NlpD
MVKFLRAQLIALGAGFVIGPISTGYAGDRAHLDSADGSRLHSMRMPLDAINVSSGFGMRADPFDQPPSDTRSVQPVVLEWPKRLDIAVGVNAKGVKANIASRAGVTRGQVLTVPIQRAGKELFNRPLIAIGINAKGAKIDVATRTAVARGLAPQPTLTVPVQRSGKKLFMHEGVDLAAPNGTPIYAASDGIVIDSASNGGYGNWIHIEHSASLSTVYGHLSAFASGIRPGVQVKEGQLIGFVGSTGHSTGPHLHFEIVSNGKPVDPFTFRGIKPTQLGARAPAN